MKRLSFLGTPVHQLLLARNGIYLHENRNTEELARDSYRFAGQPHCHPLT